MIELWGTILSIACSAIVIFALLKFFDAFFERKLKGGKYWCVALFLFAASILICLNNQGNIFLQMPLEISIQCIFCAAVYYGRWDRLFFTSATIYAINFSFSYWINQFFLALSRQSYEEYLWNIPLYSAHMFTGASLLLALALIVKRFHHPAADSGQPRVWISLFAIFPFMTLLVLLAGYYPSQEQWIWQICLMILDTVDTIALFVLDYLERSAQEREQWLVVSERARVQEENIQALSRAYGSQRKMTHDFRAHLAMLADLLENGSVADAKKYLAELRVQHTERVLLVNSHHAAVDAILNQKGYLGIQRGIDVRFCIDDLSSLHIPATDLTTVLGNLLDNAIEASATLEDARRWIKVFITCQTNGQLPELSVMVANPSDPVEVRDGIIMTSKRDTMLHGFGLQIVRDVLERYGAEQIISCDNGMFTVYCSWPDIAKPPDL